MLFRVSHVTRYAYTVPVELGPHLIRLVPQAEGLNLVEHNLEICPKPRTLVREVDGFGNEIVRVEFAESTVEFSIASHFTAQTTMPNPLEDSGWPALPWPPSRNPLLATFARSDPIAPEVITFAESIAIQVNHRPLAFLDHLSRTLFAKIDRGIRVEGAAQPALVTLETGRGACRDLSVLFLECCRAMGFVGRFVSGYQAAADTKDGERHLHAWAEVHLPGVGFRGWDAMHGLRVEDGHIALCSAPAQADTMPVEGGFAFTGASVTSTLDFSVRIETS